MNAVPPTIYTIGHSTHSIEVFLMLLSRHEVTALADVRSAPFSRYNPQFNKNALEHSLRANGVKYVFLGRQLGARPSDPSCYESGRIQYARLARTRLFKSGIERVVHGAREHRIALMCAEKEPLDCHRTLLVARALVDQGIDVMHILGSGEIEPHRSAMMRLLDLTGLPHEDLFRSEQELIAEAIAKHEEKVAYVDESLAVHSSGAAR